MICSIKISVNCCGTLYAGCTIPMAQNMGKNQDTLAVESLHTKEENITGCQTGPLKYILCMRRKQCLQAATVCYWCVCLWIIYREHQSSGPCVMMHRCVSIHHCSAGSSPWMYWISPSHRMLQNLSSVVSARLQGFTCMYNTTWSVFLCFVSNLFYICNYMDCLLGSVLQNASDLHTQYCAWTHRLFSHGEGFQPWCWNNQESFVWRPSGSQRAQQLL